MAAPRKNGTVVPMLIIVTLILTACSSSGDGTGSADAGDPTPSVGSATHTFSTDNPDFDGRYVITMKLLDGYDGSESHVVFGSDGGQGLSTWTVGNVYADPCSSKSSLLDPPIGPSVAALVTGLESQEGHPATTPTDVEVDGYPGKYMEMTVPAGIDVSDCDHGEFRTWADPLVGTRYLEAGQRDLLWIVDVDGDRLVIDAALGPQTTEQDRADRIDMVESIRIDPV